MSFNVYLDSSDIKSKCWGNKTTSTKKSITKSIQNEKKSYKTKSTLESLNSSVQSKNKFPQNKNKKKYNTKIICEEESFEKIISETSGLSLEIENIIKDPQNKFYYLPNLKSAYEGKNENQRKYLVDQFSKFLKNLFKNDFKQNLEFLKLNRVYCPVKQPNKKCLILDLDETLIFAHNKSSDKDYDEQIDLYIGEGKTHSIYVYYRPFLKDFLEYVSNYWEIGIFTSSSNIYANAIIERFDPHNKYISFRLFKNNCYRDCNKHLIKDLEIIQNRSLDEMVIVDNSINSIIYQLDNCIPIVPFFGNPNDQELVGLAKYLDFLNDQTNLRKFNRKYFKLKQFLKFHDLKSIQEFIISSL